MTSPSQPADDAALLSAAEAVAQLLDGDAAACRRALQSIPAPPGATVALLRLSVIAIGLLAEQPAVGSRAAALEQVLRAGVFPPSG